MRARKSFLPVALLRSFSGSSTGQDVGIICRKPRKNFRDASLSCAYLKHSSIGTACAYIVRVIQAKKKGAQMVESTWRELCKIIMDQKDPGRLMTLVEALNEELREREQELKSRRQQYVPHHRTESRT